MAQLLRAPAAVRMRIAHVWAFTHSDAHCVPVYQSLMYEPSGAQDQAGAIAPTSGATGPDGQRRHSALFCYACQLLGEYYAATGQPEPAIAMFQRVLQYAPANSYLGGNAAIGAAREYLKTGQDDLAHQMYARVKGYGYGWATGMAICDQASALIWKGKQEEARSLLNQQVTGLYADQIETALLAKLAYSYYRSGDFESARPVAMKALVQYRALASPLVGEGLESQVDVARAVLYWIDQMSHAPQGVVSQPAKIELSLDHWPTADEPKEWKLSFYCSKPGTLIVTSDNDHVRVCVGDAGVPRDAGLYFIASAAVTIEPGFLETRLDATIRVQRSDLPAAVPLEVPVRLSVDHYDWN
jgi:tetratricopeptide (TPR) repeat protein